MKTDVDQQNISDNIRLAQLLNSFKRFADSLDNDPKLRQTFLSLMYENRNCLQRFFYDRLNFKLLDSEVEYMNKLIQAYLRKNIKRQKISDDERTSILIKQQYKCAFCGKPVNKHSHVDHIIPFKYVGDKLENNYQILCSSCNEEKSKSFDYQIKFILEGGYQKC